jgi:molybdenum cofactor cytidylyltransferase
MGTEAYGSRLEAVVLAAGQGRRFGGGKLLAPWGDGALLDAALAAAFAAPVRSVTVVTGADERVAAAARGFADSHGSADRLRVVAAADHAEGMAASLRAGIAALPPDARGAFVFLGDMPRVPHAVLAPLAQALAKGAAAAVPVFDGRRGHPALFGRALFPDLLALAGDAGARRVLDRLGPELARVGAPDDGVLFDVDEPGDLPVKKPGSPLSRG